MGLLNTISFITRHPLTAHRRAAALARFVRWQLGSRLAPGPVAVPFIGSAKLLVKPGMTGATMNIYTGLHEFADMALVLHLLRAGDLFVDVGANVGSYTVLASAVVGAHSIAIEPVPETFEHLLDNVSLNRIGSLCECHNVALGSSESVVCFTKDLDSMNHVASTQEAGNGNTIQVLVKPLDEIVGTRTPTLVKIDVEGYEAEVLAGGRAMLSAASLLAAIVELNGSGARYGFDENVAHQQMLQYGFHPCRYSPFDRSLVELQGKSDGGNTIYVRDLQRARALVASAPVLSINGQKI